MDEERLTRKETGNKGRAKPRDISEAVIGQLRKVLDEISVALDMGALESSEDLYKTPTSQQQKHDLSINKQAVSIWLEAEISDQNTFCLTQEFLFYLFKLYFPPVLWRVH